MVGDGLMKNRCKEGKWVDRVWVEVGDRVGGTLVSDGMGNEMAGGV